MKIFSKRTNWSFNSNILISTLDQLRSQKKDILDLTASNPSKCQFDFPIDKIIKPLNNDNNIHYEPSAQGNLEPRRIICQYYKTLGYHIQPEQIFLTASTSEAYSFIFRLLADPQDQILFPSPSYPLFQCLTDLNDVVMINYNYVYDENTDEWLLDLNHFKKQIDKKTKAVVIVNPNNPTGSFIKDYELEEVRNICQKNDIALISDEVFFDYVNHDVNPKRISLVRDQTTLSFTFGGLSKCLALPQMKLSWIIVTGPRKIVDESIKRLEIISDTYLSVNTPAQNALCQWMEARVEINNQIKKRIMDNREVAYKKFAQCPKVYISEGGWYNIIRLPINHSDLDWCLKFLEEDSVFVHPGFFFDFDFEPLIILSLLTPKQIFIEGSERIFHRINES